MQGTTNQTKKHTAKDGKKNKESAPDPEIELLQADTKFEDALFKRIKNAKKKLRAIEELAEKTKDKEFIPNEAQREKLGSRPKLEAELNEVRGQAVMYLEAKKDQEKKQKKDLEKLEASSKKQAVRQVASILSMSTVVQKGHSLASEDENVQMAQGIQHFTKCINTLMNSGGGPYSWSSALDAFASEMNKAVLGQGATIPGTEMSYKEFGAALPEALQQLPAVIDDKKEVEEEEVEEDPVEEEEEPAEEEEVHHNGTAASEPVAVEEPEAEEVEDAPVEKEEEEKQPNDGADGQAGAAVKGAEEPAGETAGKAEGDEAGEAAAGGEEGGRRGDRGRGGRGYNRGRGHYRGRGNYEDRGRGRGRGRGGEGGEGGDGDKFYRNQRPRTARPPKDQEDSDFVVVGKKDQRGGRGRGYNNRVRRGGPYRGGERGDRGGEGNYRGGEGNYRGGEGNYRGGDGSSRGNRGYRGGDRGGERPGFAAAEKPVVHQNGDTKSTPAATE